MAFRNMHRPPDANLFLALWYQHRVYRSLLRLLAAEHYQSHP